MDRQALLRHVRALHFESGDRPRARADAKRIAAMLRRQGARRVFGIGSAFEEDRPFTRRSDLDLVVDGLPPALFFSAWAEAEKQTALPIDLKPLETATEAFRSAVYERGVPL